MIGVYDYTVILTYLSALSAVVGAGCCLDRVGHPILGMFFLLFSGLCDGFDGKVARTKKNRTELEKGFGIQIDSLSDLLAFGMLPACMGVAILRNTTVTAFPAWLRVIFFVVAAFYTLAALIRLAYFNVTEEERQKTETGARTYYEGLPVTTSALIFPLVMLIADLAGADWTLSYFVTMFIVGLLFISKVRVPKPGGKRLYVFILFGLAELIALIVHFAVRIF